VLEIFTNVGREPGKKRLSPKRVHFRGSNPNESIQVDIIGETKVRDVEAGESKYCSVTTIYLKVTMFLRVLMFDIFADWPKNAKFCTC
jgi:hypothetical protein